MKRISLEKMVLRPSTVDLFLVSVLVVSILFSLSATIVDTSNFRSGTYSALSGSGYHAAASVCDLLQGYDGSVIEKNAVTCPAGCRTMMSNYNEKPGSTTFFFKKEVCQDCSLKGQCTKQDRRTITIGKHYELIKEAKEYNKTKEYKEDIKGRAKIEP